ncbi:MAG TPA: protein kinase [Phycisphaerae bacterium]|nr:protein kinase [Phycisphaerae bacterium]
MSPREWHVVCEAFDLLRQTPEFERAQRMAELDLTQELRETVIRLLESDADARAKGRFAPGSLINFAPPDSEPIGWIGQYRLIRRLGAGGMGEVFLAESTHPKRLVALKLLFAHQVSSHARNRFEAEADFLARLDHPAVTKIFQFDVADEGPARNRPYVVMEYVEGLPLDQYVKRQKPDLRARIRLLAGICAGVQHAHQKSIIHRDLKPANILVAPGGAPKIVDFGVARFDDSGQLVQSTTMTGHVVGTLAYMSPEQLERKSHQIDTRSDIYALGVVGYSLFAECMPYDIHNMPLAEALRAIIRGPSQAAWEKIPGDLRFVIRKAMRVDPNARYASAGEFEQDLRHLLTGAAVIARPSTIGYELRVFWRSHWRLVVTVALIATVLVSATAVSIYFAFSADRARVVAVNAQSDLQDAIEFLESTLEQTDPSVAYGQQTTLRQALRHVVERRDELQDPGARTSVLLLCARLYLAIGTEGGVADGQSLYAEASELASEACTLASRLDPPDPAKLAEALATRGRAEFRTGYHQESIDSYQRAIAIVTDGAAFRDSALPEYQLRLATVYSQSGDLPKARDLTLKALSAIGDDPRLASEANVLLGDFSLDDRDFESAEKRFRRAVTLTETVPALRYLHAAALDKLGMALDKLGKLDEAAVHQEEALAMRREMLPESHPAIARSLLAIGLLHRGRGDHQGLLNSADKAVIIYDKAYGDPNHPSVLRARRWRAEALANLGRIDEAIEENDALILAFKQNAKLASDLVRSYLRRANLALDSGNCEKAQEDIAAARDAEQAITNPPPTLDGEFDRTDRHATEICPDVFGGALDSPEPVGR